MTERRVRGPGRKTPLVHVTLRLPAEVVDYFTANGKLSEGIREALLQHVREGA
jgi:hypothetical protein